jgi:hypothetical protein
MWTDSTERFRISNAGAFGLSGANYGTAGQVLTSAGNAAPPTWSDAVDTALTNRVTAVEQGGTLTLATAQASTSGSSIDFSAIPAWVKRISVIFSGVSTNGTSNLLVQIGDAGGFETTGYVSYAGDYNDLVGSTIGFVQSRLNAAAYITSGSVTLLKVDGTTWVASGVLSSAHGPISSAGSKALSDVLTQVRVTTVNGTDAFDAGSINILYE